MSPESAYVVIAGSSERRDALCADYSWSSCAYWDESVSYNQLYRELPVLHLAPQQYRMGSLSAPAATSWPQLDTARTIGVSDGNTDR